jgi:hypothetical protein
VREMKFVDTVSPEIYSEVILRHWKSFVASNYSRSQFSRQLWQHLSHELSFYGDEYTSGQEFFDVYFSDWESTFEFLMGMGRELRDTELNREILRLSEATHPKIEMHYLKQEELHLMDRIHYMQEELRKVQNRLEIHYINCTVNSGGVLKEIVCQ